MMSQFDFAKEFSQFGPWWLLVGLLVVAALLGTYRLISGIVMGVSGAAREVASAHKEFLTSTQEDMHSLAASYKMLAENMTAQTEILREIRSEQRRRD